MFIIYWFCSEYKDPLIDSNKYFKNKVFKCNIRRSLYTWHIIIREEAQV